VTLVAPFCLGDLIEIPILLHQFELFGAPVHGISICRKIYNITLKMREGIIPIPPRLRHNPMNFARKKIQFRGVFFWHL
jgi:hypothetical protein